MPFTPFHFGPALLLKSITRKFSFTVFVFSQVVMDLEPLYFMLRDESPAHRLFHTFLGCNLAVFISFLLGKPLCGLWLRAWKLISRLNLETVISWRTAFASAVLGAYSHVFLDGLMHRDMKPFWPLAEGNPMIGFVSGKSVYDFCVSCAAAAFLILFFRMKKGQR